LPAPQIDALSGVGVCQLSCGSYHTLAMTTGGEVYSTGFGGSFFNGAGGLGHGNRSQLDEPKRIPTFGRGSGLVAAVSVSAGALLRSSLRIHMDESSAGHAKKKSACCLQPRR